MKNTLLFSRNFNIIFGRLGDTNIHDHYAIQLCFTLNDPFKIITSESEKEYTSVIIPSKVPHQFLGADSESFNLLVNPLSPEGMQFQEKYKTITNLDDIDWASICKLIAQDIASTQFEFVNKRITSLYGLFNFNTTYSNSLDSRIISALNYIESNTDQKISITDLSNVSFLSESRLTHLFKEQTGVPIRKLILWQRLLLAIELITMQGHNLTQAAHAAGFTDSAHLSNSFKKTFGISPSIAFQNDQFLQAYRLD